jgi:hypothetical protein
MNIIELSVDIVDGEFLMLNNDLPVGSIATTGIFRFEITNLDKNNKLALQFTGKHAVINYITMFDMGKEKLKYMGIYHEPNGNSYQSHECTTSGVWTLEYNYPVFAWLHNVLDLGWLVDSDKV